MALKVPMPWSTTSSCLIAQEPLPPPPCKRSIPRTRHSWPLFKNSSNRGKALRTWALAKVPSFPHSPQKNSASSWAIPSRFIPTGTSNKSNPSSTASGGPRFSETHAKELQHIKEELKRIITYKEDGTETVPITEMINFYYNVLNPLLDLNIRNSEKEIIESVQEHLTLGERSTPKPDDSGVFTYPKGHMATAISLLDSLTKVNTDKADISDIKHMKTVVLPKDLKVIGIYQATRHAYSPDVFVPLPVGQDLTGLGDGVRGIALRLDDPYKAADVLQKSILPNMPDDGMWQARTWMEDHQQQFSLIKTQRQLLTFCLSFIMMVSAFSIMAVMFTVTIQKKREIGVMKALGAAPAQLVRVFLYQGIIIGFFGGLIGLGLGYLVITNRQSLLDLFASWGFDPFPSEFNGFEGLPAIMRTEEFVGVFLFAFLMCVLATFVPAIVASRSDAAKSLRNM